MAPLAAQEDLKLKGAAQWVGAVDLFSTRCLVRGTDFPRCLLEKYFPGQGYNLAGVPMGGGQVEGPKHRSLDHHLW